MAHPQEINPSEMAIQMLSNGTPEVYHTIITAVEQAIFVVAIKHTNGNITGAARLLGISRLTLRKRLRAMGLSFRPARKRER